ncbi:hypothetical protein SCD_n01191 [Sulfuricella denitrificans skB26]|uniref:Plasmid recombination enzyme n=1 Tax=Sulfuricella denitrificans (strain DSM 22764 / NBRC 105220 / skB26) TaxID=1163617 RepID=S6AA05_SULDS|nr:plasmid recombination protein [Sulfuricella denitrificans]BAN35020.1 hypothetical protein SCD_n01191 [Sulfuricella denitrificans skB26]
MEHIQVFRIKKLKGSGIIAVAARHNLREMQSEIGSDSHINPRMTSHNLVLRGAVRAADVAAQAVNLMEQAQLKKPLQKNAVHALELLFSLPISSGIAEQDYFSAAADWAEGFFEIPILSAVIHNDEAAPHCHIIMLPLFNGRMIGSAMVGNRTRLLAMQTDFHTIVGQRYGLKRGEPTKRYSRAARATAADSVVTALRRVPKSLDDPAIRDALREAIAETMPVNLMALLELDLPAVRTPKPKTLAEIMTKPCKPEKPIGFQSKKPIGFAATISTKKDQTLSCVGFADSTIPVSPDNALNQNEYTRESENGQAATYWDEDQGKFIQPPARAKLKSAEIDRVRVAIQGMQR